VLILSDNVLLKSANIYFVLIVDDDNCGAVKLLATVTFPKNVKVLTLVY
jgi:hypothetical protein